LLKEPNPLNVFNLRTLTIPAPHFEYCTIPMTYNLLDAITNWVKDNLKGRYYIGPAIDLDQRPVLKIGFEEPKELSYFMLACPLLKYN
tara:strand:+ start:5447 stop:5710 length:264 start_codon:yes stop_codon:yes gene_type:complete